MKKTIRIAAGSGFWGDWLEAPALQIRSGPIDYLVLDYLAELTMSILVRQQKKDPVRGYAHDFVSTLDPLLKEITAKKIRVIANAGGVNPEACALALKQCAEKQGLASQVKCAFVDGDNLLPRLDSIINSGWQFDNLDTKQPISAIRSRILSANAYLGAGPVVEALNAGASIVVTGRVADASLAVAPLLHEFPGQFNGTDQLALATIAGHVIECGAQASGGNLSAGWQTVPDLEHIGFPIIETSGPEAIVITKHDRLGGRVDQRAVKEQLVYEIGDPRSYTTPDVVADFTSIKLDNDGPNRIRISGARGKPPTDYLKVSIAYEAGFKAECSLVYSWPDAAAKAQRASQIVRRRLEDLNLKFDAFHAEILGAGACHPGMTGPAAADLPEAVLRLAVRGQDRRAVERFCRELTPLVLGGPPGATGYTGPRAQVHEVYGYWPALVPRNSVTPRMVIV